MMKIPEVSITRPFRDTTSRSDAFLFFARMMQEWDGGKVTLEATTHHGDEITWRFRFQTWDEAKRFDAMFDQAANGYTYIAFRAES